MSGSTVSLRGSIAARLALGHALLVALAIAAVSLVFWFGTVGVLERSIDNRIRSVATRLQALYRDGGDAALRAGIDAQLGDHIDSDTEILLLLAPGGRRVAGNLSSWPGPLAGPRKLGNWRLRRGGELVSARLLAVELDGGRLLVVGRDLREMDAISGVVEHALEVGFAASLLLALGGALLFRRQLERRIGQIRGIAGRIGAGDLSQRIAVRGDDEFARLALDINRMLDRIEELMERVRHVSNSIAHDLRTPLGRVRARLEQALQDGAGRAPLAAGARAAIEDIDSVITMFDRLLQIAAAESGLGRASFELLDLDAIARDMVELYEAAAEDQGVALKVCPAGPVRARGDRHLLAGALASLIDNAIKYGAAGTRVQVGARAGTDWVALEVRDDGPGVPPAELPRLCERFYRVDRSRHLPGNGLGLSTVAAIAQLHGGRLALANLAPGLEARVLLPLSGAAAKGDEGANYYGKEADG